MWGGGNGMNFLDLEKLKRYTTKMFSYIDRKIKNQVETLGNSDNIKDSLPPYTQPPPLCCMVVMDQYCTSISLHY